ncbi:MAG TPA: Crp/Fnr family transcriptional regulator [bacterium]|nr:Crp/Fnr family transcriptional regulator [bacterium]
MTETFPFSSVFPDFGESAFGDFSRHLRIKVYEKGQIVFHEGSRASGLYFLLSGHVKLYKTGIDGKQQIVSIAGPGDIMGHRSLFSEGPYRVTASALGSASMGIIETEILLPLLKEHAGLTLALLKRLAADLNAAEDLATNIAQRPVRERLARLLLMLQHSFGRRNDEEVSIEIGLSHEEIGEMIGVTRETATRLLSRFRKEGLIDIKQRQVTVLDLSGLSRAAREIKQ